MLNMTWAMTIVLNPSGKTRPFGSTPLSGPPGSAELTNSVRRLEPITISGVAIGRKMRPFIAPRPRISPMSGER